MDFNKFNDVTLEQFKGYVDNQGVDIQEANYHICDCEGLLGLGIADVENLFNTKGLPLKLHVFKVKDGFEEEVKNTLSNYPLQDVLAIVLSKEKMELPDVTDIVNVINDCSTLPLNLLFDAKVDRDEIGTLLYVLC